MNPPDIKARKIYLDFAHKMAIAAANAALPYFRAGVEVDNKLGSGGFDPVTKADRNAEQVMREMIARTYPEHNIRGEEFGFDDKGSDFTWILDPIDGTRSFIMGIPLWGTVIGLAWRGGMIAGVVSQPFTGEIFSGEGQSAAMTGPHGNGALKTRRCKGLDEAVLATTDPRLFTNPGEYDAYKSLESKVRLARYGGDCYIYCMLAAGQIDLIVEADLADYDIAGLIPIVEGAGGIITTWKGGNAANGGRVVASGDAQLHEQVLEQLSLVC